MAAAAESERRQATILFADISGFTSMSEKLDPEEVTSIMGECFALLGSIIEENGGFIDKFIGDCVMALFGVPRAVEGAPRKAIAAALKMREAVEAFNERRKFAIPLGIHIGMNSGEVLAGELGSAEKRDFTVMGDAVNLASRLKDAAPRGTIYVGPTTRRLADAGFVYAELEALALKGKQEPVHVYELLGELKGGTEGRPAGSPFMGRRRELDVLELQVLKAINGEGSVIQLVGEAGIGKTRLVSELRELACMRRVTFLSGSARESGKNLSYHPFSELLRSWAGISDVDFDEEAGAKLSRAVRSADPGDAESLLPFVATLAGLGRAGKWAGRLEGMASDALSALVVGGARDLLRAIARGRPAVVVLEDMQWADESSLELAADLFKPVSSESLMIIVVLRPDEGRSERYSSAVRDALGDRYSEIRLGPLDSASGAELSRVLLCAHAAVPRLVDSIVERSGGNPFFIEELARAWIDERSRRESAGSPGEAETPPLPSSISELIMLRYDRLDPGSRGLLRIASTIGQGFDARFLSKIAAQGEGSEDATETIEKLVRMQFLQEGEAEGEYSFRSALAREAIYSSMLLQTRKDLHRRTAEALEELYVDRAGQYSAILAWHWSLAEDLDKAEAYMSRAGEAALGAAASSEAIAFYRGALALYRKKKGETADPGKVASYKTSIAKALADKGRYAEALPCYDELIGGLGIVFPSSPIAAGASALSGMLGAIAWARKPSSFGRERLTPEVRECFSLLLERMSILSAFDPTTFAKHALITWHILAKYDLRGFEPGLIFQIGAANLFAMSGRTALSGKAIAKMRPLAGEDSPKAWVALALAMTMHKYIAGDWSEGVSIRDPRIRSQLERGMFLDIQRLYYMRALAEIETGDWTSFLETATLMEEDSERFDNDDARGLHCMVMMRYWGKRRMSGAVTAALPAIAKLYSSGSLSLIGTLAMALYTMQAALLRGDLAEAEEAAALMRSNFEGMRTRKSGAVHVVSGALMARAWLRLERLHRGKGKGPLDAAVKRSCRIALREYLRNAEKFMPDLVEALRFFGDYYWITGEPPRAIAYWKRSIGEGERLGAEVELAHVLVDAGRLLGDASPGPEWKARGDELYERLGLGEGE